MPQNDDDQIRVVTAPDFKVIYANEIHLGVTQSDYQITCFVVTGDEQGALSIRQAILVLTNDVRRKLTKSLNEFPDAEVQIHIGGLN